MNGISYPYQKLKRFYKGVLNLGPDYIRDAKMEEWLIRGHINVHVFSDINTAYPLYTIRRIDSLDVISLYFLCILKTLLSVLAIRHIHAHDTAYSPKLTRHWKQRISTNIGGEFTNLEDLKVLES
ncbi:hypothetical protein Tco_0878058 [Tanacetum coccineum]|uniref:Uncharacterized protein n=1 Tax=Tanacetum coccineum TaxID=301880 RepID=A0ABQ5BZU6_9ASTR